MERRTMPGPKANDCDRNHAKGAYTLAVQHGGRNYCRIDAGQSPQSAVVSSWWTLLLPRLPQLLPPGSLLRRRLGRRSRSRLRPTLTAYRHSDAASGVMIPIFNLRIALT